MRNIYAVTTHIRKKLEAAGETEIDRKVLTFMPAKDDETKLYAIVDGQYWRMMIFIENAVTKQAVNPESSRAAGKAFGQFQATEVKIDRRGIEVSNADSQQRTVISNTEFSGYYNDEVIFTLNKDETKTKKTTVDGELTVGKTKFVPMPTASEGLNIVILD